MQKIIGIILSASLALPGLFAAQVTLQNGTATFSQTDASNLKPSNAIDGITSGNGGWGIRSGGSNVTDEETAVFELATILDSDHGYSFIIEMHHNYGHRLLAGRFRLSVTADDQSTFADGLHTNGDVTANWTPLEFDTASATNGVTLSVQPDGSYLVGSADPYTSVYTLVGTFKNPAGSTKITGIRIEMLEHSSLPSLGPGRYHDGNLVLTEFEVDFTELPVDDRHVGGSMGIGTAPQTTHRLAVDGGIRARSITVDSATWADFVFDANYQLPTLLETESHISRFGHLPGIPSEAEALREGVDLGAFQVKLLQKIEELTLHQIAQEKRIIALELENVKLRSSATAE